MPIRPLLPTRLDAGCLLPAYAQRFAGYYGQDIIILQQLLLQRSTASACSAIKIRHQHRRRFPCAQIACKAMNVLAAFIVANDILLQSPYTCLRESNLHWWQVNGLYGVVSQQLAALANRNSALVPLSAYYLMHTIAYGFLPRRICHRDKDGAAPNHNRSGARGNKRQNQAAAAGFVRAV